MEDQKNHASHGNRERKVWRRVFELYRKTPLLWDKNHNQYKNLSLRMKSFRALLDIYHEFDDEATLDFLKNKIMNMRTSFLREYKKVQSRVPGESDSEQSISYVPSLWYYNELLFLVEPDYVYDRKSTDSDEPSITMCINAASHFGNLEKSTQHHTSDIQSTPPYKKARAMKNDKTEKNGHKVAEQSYQLEDMDEFDSFGKMISLELRKLRHPHQPIAQKLISDVLYYAKMGKLTESSSISIPMNICTVETRYYNNSSPEVEKLENELE